MRPGPPERYAIQSFGWQAMTNKFTKAFESGLNQHGYAFQQRVIREAARLNDDPKSRKKWNLLATEQPVAVGDTHTRIDFILEYQSADSQLSLIVAECKRVNPAYGSWCFAKGAYQRPVWLGTQVVVEVLALEEDLKSGGAGGPTSDHIFDIGFSVKTDAAGDPTPVSGDRDGLEQACQQVCRGLNGLIQVLATDPTLAKTKAGVDRVDFLPVIFTTAKLFTSAVDLRTTDLSSGQVQLPGDVVERDWLYFQYPQSPGLVHSLNRWPEDGDIWSEVVAREYFRSVAIVSANGIGEFLSEVWPPSS